MNKLVLAALTTGFLSLTMAQYPYALSYDPSQYAEDKQNEDTLHYDGPNNIGLGGGTLTHYRAAVRFTPWEIAVPGTLIAVIFYHYEPMAHSGSLYVHQVHQESTQVEPFTAIGVGWHRIDLSPPYAYNDSMDLWIAIEIFFNPGEYPVGVDPGPAVDFKGDWISLDYGQSWAELQSYGLDYNWNIRAIVHPEEQGIEETALHSTPDALRLDVCPNPFRDRIDIQITMDQRRRTINDFSLKIYDVSGRTINSFSLPTSYFLLSTSIEWNGTDLTDREVPAGVYFLHFMESNFSVVKKVVRLE